MIFNTPDRIRDLTPLNPFERLDDGRPNVPESLLERMKLVTIEEAWRVLRDNGYHFQFEGNFQSVGTGEVVVGRAVTAAFTPIRPDFDAVVEEAGRRLGHQGSQNTWVIDTLVEHDVVVVDLFGKIKDGTFAGDNLSTAIHSRTGTGMVIDGGVRDLPGIRRLPEFAVFVRGVDPTAILNVSLREVNGPIRIGETTVLPGDVVLGTSTGVIFIPPHLANAVVEASEDTRLRDEFSKMRIREGVYSSGDIDVSGWPEPIESDYQRWRDQLKG